MERVNVEAISGVVEALRDEEFRLRFSSDPEGALGFRGIAPVDLPASYLELLRGLGQAELRLLGQLADLAANWDRPDFGPTFV